jgi:hypothetical protein
MLRKGRFEFELIHQVDNTQLFHFASGLKAQMPRQPPLDYRLLYDAHDAEHKPDGSDYTIVPPFPTRKHDLRKF